MVMLRPLLLLAALGCASAAQPAHPRTNALLEDRSTPANPRRRRDAPHAGSLERHTGRDLERRNGEDKDAKAAPSGGVSGYGEGTRALTVSMGLPVYGMDCCPCLANEEDYRVYPVRSALGSASFLQKEHVEGEHAHAQGSASDGAREAPLGRRGAALLELEAGVGQPGRWAGMNNPNGQANRMAQVRAPPRVPPAPRPAGWPRAAWHMWHANRAIARAGGDGRAAVRQGLLQLPHQ